MPVQARLRDQERLTALERYDILDTPPEEGFDRITRLTRRIFGVAMSTVTFLDGHRQWFKSRQGVEAYETPRGPALCDVAVRQAWPLVVPDTLNDERFRDNPFVLGEPYIRFYAGVPLRTPDGQALGTLCAMDTEPRTFDREEVDTLVDLARIVETELELRHVAMTDSLTGALSRRAFRERGDQAVALALRHRHDLSCIAFDLDHFKAVNDTFGHAVGDRVLVETTAACRTKLRKSDLLGRMGGEEFAILLPHTGGAAIKAAEKVRTAIAKHAVETPGGPIGVTASLGVATLDRSITDIDVLLHRADLALYEAKAAGRNRSVAWSSPAPVVTSIRRRVLKAGRISFNTGGSTIDCTVRALSEEGASLDVFSASGIPDQFKLQIEADHLYRACRVTHKSDKKLEVAFA